MKIPPDAKYTEEMLRDAMELLAESIRNAGLFQRQRYLVLKKRFDEHRAINDSLRVALNGINTVHNDKEGYAKDKKTGD